MKKYTPRAYFLCKCDVRYLSLPGFTTSSKNDPTIERAIAIAFDQFKVNANRHRAKDSLCKHELKNYPQHQTIKSYRKKSEKITPHGLAKIQFPINYAFIET